MLSWEENGAAGVQQQLAGAEQRVHILGSSSSCKGGIFPAALVVAEDFGGLSWFNVLGQAVI